ncbi:Alpha/Beta hydrolase protein [Suillus subalutaceus]|uniref:Alpha/Beta hydrolase protein n=1 Tax=Suillus subalutaceus TaxID=48586 RepID=UPI001B8645B4|nr:Alpha/Beta hydrolase protein [Suillus subalutaceus]KAG1848773.1 Alpha/Beta hydrolase protein [Suillus subalutaceus]
MVLGGQCQYFLLEGRFGVPASITKDISMRCNLGDRINKLTALRAKLQLATFPDELENAQWKFGSPLADIKRLTERWRNGYDWRQHEKAINEELPMFTRDIDVDGFGALNFIMFTRRAKLLTPFRCCFATDVGPGSFFEVIRILPLLTASTAEHPSFHVVALSLPGFGFSEAPHKQGFGINQYAEVAHKLMVALGYNEYVTQGGDWGGIITRKMASTYGGRHLKAWHTNFPIPEPPSWKSPLSFLSFLLTPWSIEEKAGIERTKWFRTKGQGYSAQQSTQPQTLGYSLTDSPVGLLAWIYEKLVLWTDNYYWSDDEVLTWISLYWFSRAGPAASLRIYFELRGDCEDLGRNPTIPMGASWLRKSNNVVFESHHKTGGHFAATERPEELVRDVRKMFAKGSPAFAIVPGRTGYDAHVQQ